MAVRLCPLRALLAKITHPGPPAATRTAAPDPWTVGAPFLNTAPVDVLGMADAFGLGVDMHAIMPPDLAGRMLRDGTQPSGYRIDINDAHSSNRKRFTLAHLIGHFLLHRDRIGDGIADDAHYQSRLAEPAETEANRLAVKILMPDRLVRNIYHAGLTWPAGLSVAFQVSDQAMHIRLSQLRLAVPCESRTVDALNIRVP